MLKLENFLPFVFCFCILFSIIQTLDNDKCFCQLSGQIDDCFCDIETLETFNNKEVYPLLQKLIKKKFFRYYKVNLFKPCMYFDGDAGLCENESCGVKTCEPEELPEGMRSNDSFVFCIGEQLGTLNETLSNKTIDLLDKWDQHDDTIHRFCDPEDDPPSSYQYVDLLANPERFTGYAGPMANRIWQAIYEENCFVPEVATTNYYNPMFGQASRGRKTNKVRYSSELIKAMCLEKRVFYRVISGLHTSINTHVCAEYLFEDKFVQKWGPNLQEFQRRFDPKLTEGEGTERLKNLYFIYLVELRALSKVAQYFKRDNVNLYTGNSKDDHETKQLLMNILDKTKDFPMHFDEGVMFRDKSSPHLKKEFAERFLNVTRIIDCVTCEKCRLWGKLQTKGLGTALKILFSHVEIHNDKVSFRLSRQEVVSLVNAFARLSSSIKSLEVFRDLIRNSGTSSSKLHSEL